MTTRLVPDPPDDAELIQLVASGDAEAYRILVDRHLRGLFGFLRRMLGNGAEAEEVCQETFLRLWNRAGTFGARSRPSTWIYRIAHNLAVDRLRRRRERSHPAAVDAARASGRPSSYLHRKQLAEAVQEALSALPERQRSAISLVHYHGMSNAEAAEVLGVGLRALESLLARGRQSLRERLEAYYPSGDDET